MMIKMKEHIDKEYKAVLERKSAEYEALQARINPHFLYNTLAGFVTLNRLGDKVTLQEGILALTGMMRYIFEKNSVNTIKNEIKFVKQYLDLSKMRFDERLQYVIEVSKALEGYKIPKLILQPIVENSIVHGLEPSSEVCEIEIHIKSIQSPFGDDKDYIGIIIKDTGVGFDTKMDYLKPGEGLYNIKERIELAFEKSIFHIESIEGVGTTTTIIISCRGEQIC